MLSIIAAIGKNRELGRNGGLIFRLPGDLRFFRETTVGHKVVMGRKTWESLPRKLPGRTNIVVSTDMHLVAGEVDSANPDLVYRDVSTLVRDFEDVDEEVFVIGGGMLYWELIKNCRRMYLTEVEAEAEADVFFPEFDKSEWERKVLKEGSDDGVVYQHVLYTRK